MERLFNTLSILETEEHKIDEHNSAIQQLQIIFKLMVNSSTFFDYLTEYSSQINDARNRLEHYRRAGRNDICAMLDIFSISVSKANLSSCLNQRDTKQLQIFASKK